MIKKGSAAANWRWRYALTASLTSTGYRTSATGTYTYTWGQSYSAGIHGWQLQIVDLSAAPGGVPGAQYQAIFADPWGAGYDSGVQSGAAPEYRVYAINALLVGGCYTYVLTLDRIELRTWDGVTETTVYTATPGGPDTGAYMEIHNEDLASCSTAVAFGPAPGYPSCPATESGLPGIVYTITATATADIGCEVYSGGAWTKYNLDIINPGAIGLSCPCSGTLDSITDADLSWDVSVPGYYQDQVSYALYVNQVCTCAATGLSYTAPIYALTRVLEYRTANAGLKDKTCPGRQHTVTRYRECNDNGVITTASDGPITYTDADNVSACHRDYEYESWTAYCRYPPHIIPPCPFPDDYVCVPSSYPANSLCESSAYVDVILLEPTCTNPVRTPALITTSRGRLNHANINAFTKIRYRSGPFAKPSWTVDVVMTSTDKWQMVDIAEQTKYGRIEMRAVQDDGAGNLNAYRMWSDDQGATWNPLSAGVLAPQFVMAAVQSRVRSTGAGKPEVLLEINFVPDSGSSGPGTLSGRIRPPSTNVFGAPFTLQKWDGAALVNLRSDGSGFDFYWSTDNTGRWILVLVQDGDTDETFWMSADRGLTWLQST